MVLQQSPARSQIWGYSTSANDTISASLIVSSTNEVVEKLSYTTSTNLVWLFQFSPVTGMNDYEYTISITSQTLSQTISLTNILFGDVYVCSGQSNMQFTVDQAFNSSEEIANADNYNNIRLFSVGLIGAATPQIELPSIMQEWSVASSTSVGGGNWTYFSGLCWFYGRNLYDNLQYPIGLIASSYGGTPIEDWMSTDSLAMCNYTMGNAARVKLEERLKLQEGLELSDENKEFEDKLELFRKMNEKNGNNGEKKFENSRNFEQNDKIEKLLKSDKMNVFKQHKRHRSSKSSLMQQTQKQKQTRKISKYVPDYIFDNIEGLNFTDLWNAMIVPLLFETIKGAIWYQGEADGLYPYASEYTCTFPTMINSWRYEWSLYSDTSSIFPFGFVQLSVWDDTTENVTCGNNYEDCTPVAAVRYGQTCNYGYVPNPRLNDNVYFATAIDLGDPYSPFGDIHPRYKQQVGKRLSNAALNVIYGMSEIYIQGPVLNGEGFAFKGNNTIQINFRNVGEQGLEIKNIIGFEVFTNVNDVYWMDAPLVGNGINVIGDGGFTIEMMIDSGSISVDDIELVRYNWYTAPCLPNEGIYNCAVYDKQNGLPAIPFIAGVAVAS